MQQSFAHISSDIKIQQTNSKIMKISHNSTCFNQKAATKLHVFPL